MKSLTLAWLVNFSLLTRKILGFKYINKILKDYYQNSAIGPDSTELVEGHLLILLLELLVENLKINKVKFLLVHEVAFKLIHEVKFLFIREVVLQH